MSNAAQVFESEVKAVDESSKVLEQIKESYKKVGQEVEKVGSAADHAKEHLKTLGHEAEHAGRAEGHIHHPHMWMELGEHIDLTKEKFHGLHASIGEIGESFTELLPAFAAFGAAASVSALFETAEHAADAYGELAHQAAKVGTSANNLNVLHVTAKLTDTSVESLDKFLEKLNINLGEAASGKNKQLAANLKWIGFNPRQYHDSAQALLVLADAFQHANQRQRAMMAKDLGGKGGVDLIPVLSLGKEKLTELIEEGKKLTIDLTPYGKQLEEYNEAQKKLNIAVSGFTTLLGAKLAPVLQPLTDKATKWVLANREWLTDEITNGVKKFTVTLIQMPWKAIGHDLELAGAYAEDFIDDMGGVRVAIDVLVGVMALKTVKFLAEPAFELAGFTKQIATLTYKIGTELVHAWNGVEAAAGAAAAKEGAAASFPVAAAAGVKAATSAEIAAAAAASTTGAAGVDRLQARMQAAEAEKGLFGTALNIGEAAGKMIALRAFGAGAQIGLAAWHAQDGVDLSKEDVRKNPQLAKMMTQAEFAALPDHIAQAVPVLGITDDPANPGWIERHWRFGKHYSDASRDNDLPFNAESLANVEVVPLEERELKRPAIVTVNALGHRFNGKRVQTVAPASHEERTNFTAENLASMPVEQLEPRELNSASVAKVNSLRGHFNTQRLQIVFPTSPDDRPKYNFPDIPSPRQNEHSMQNGRVDVYIHLPALPPGTMVETKATGNVGKVSTNLGEAWMDDYR